MKKTNFEKPLLILVLLVVLVGSLRGKLKLVNPG